MSLKKTYSIQSADMSIKAEAGWKSPAKMVELYSSYDWASELALKTKLMATGDDVCPPGLILVRESGVFLHLCPELDSTVTIYCTQKLQKKFLGILTIGVDKLITMSGASHALAHRAIEKFMAEDENWLQTNIKED